MSDYAIIATMITVGWTWAAVFTAMTFNRPEAFRYSALAGLALCLSGIVCTIIRMIF